VVDQFSIERNNFTTDSGKYTMNIQMGKLEMNSRVSNILHSYFVLSKTLKYVFTMGIKL